MQSVSSRIWTRVAVSFSYDDNHYTTGTSIGLAYVFRELDNLYNDAMLEITMISKGNIYWRVYI